MLESLRSGVVVVDSELMVQAWNHRAADLWGLRSDEAVGRHLLNLDIGLPTDRIRPIVRNALTDGRSGTDGEDRALPRTDDQTDSPAPAERVALTVEAINRRGRTVRIAITVDPLRYREVLASVGPVEPRSVRATPATPARPEPMKNVSRSLARVLMPTDSARSRFCTVARIRRPNALYLSSAARHASEDRARATVKIWR